VALNGRLRQFGLSLHPAKTRLIEFGRYAAERRKRRGQGKPETFNFLGFTHFCGKSRTSGNFVVRRVTMAKRLRAALQAIKANLLRHLHRHPADIGRWLQRVVRGYFNYHAVPGNYDRLASFRTQVIHLWLRVLRRRSQRHRLNWARFARYAERWIPHPRIIHPSSYVRFFATHPR